MLQLIVYQNVVVSLVILNLTSRCIQSPLDHFVAIFTTLAQALFQRLAVRRQNENAGGFRHFVLDLFGALYVDIEQKIAAILLGFQQKAARRSIVISKYFRMFEERIFPNHLLELSP